MVTDKGKFKNFLRLCCHAAIPLIFFPPQVEASAINSNGDLATNNILPAIQIPETNIPELPPLGEADEYLPREENFSEPVSVVTRLVIKLGSRRVYVYQGKNELVSYPIAIGRAGWETPTGSFQVMQKMRDPVWEHPLTGELVPPGPNNPLGDRWIGFWTDGTNYIGFHGTPNEQLVGQAVSHGCIRMFNQDVRALFEKVTVGTPVIVEP
ncbi:MAG: L,D-transpeptidase [Oscillatoria sp. PMC 1051.18]|nr:L,D-transpeptidase [Oscillatoria sp. PMC 1050.18]MEC5030273.1 L,D-transpeptidase [Oscillatoria sp. PMC 1051.18]